MPDISTRKLSAPGIAVPDDTPPCRKSVVKFIALLKPVVTTVPGTKPDRSVRWEKLYQSTVVGVREAALHADD